MLSLKLNMGENHLLVFKPKMEGSCTAATLQRQARQSIMSMTHLQACMRRHLVGLSSLLWTGAVAGRSEACLAFAAIFQSGCQPGAAPSTSEQSSLKLCM